MNKSKTNEEVLQDLLLDIECLDELSPWTKKFNVFDVLRISKTEIRHSNMLAWLFDPNENHGIGEQFLKGIIQRIVEYDYEKKFDVFKLLLLELDDFIVYREWHCIDLLLVSVKENILIAIENKVASKEHSNQLERYKEILNKEYPNHQKIHVFLTPDGEEPSDVDNWCVLTYIDIVEILEGVNKRIELLPEVGAMINNYIEIIRRDIVEDEKLISICNKIYEKHKRALDLIYDNRVDSVGQLSDLIKGILKEYSEEGEIILFPGYMSMKSYIRFNTDLMNDKIGFLDEYNSTWNTKEAYYYWFRVEDERFRLVLELGGYGISDSHRKKFNKIISWKKPSDNADANFKYKRVWGTKWYSIKDDDDEEEIRKKVIKAFDELKNFEDEFQKNVDI